MDLTRKARETLARIANVALATVTPDGCPWNSPVYTAFDKRAFYWSSQHDSVHSKNIAVNPSVLIVAFDSVSPDASGHAVYVRARARELTDERAIRIALESLGKRKGEPPRPPADFTPPNQRRVYEAVPDTFWTNIVLERDGHFFDERVVVEL
jgi:nitroimidazol reductase NimA-like FMN-containing flavoprotein (pyridoxamine 5'-phosphate oxidase superfamily)